MAEVTTLTRENLTSKTVLRRAPTPEGKKGAYWEVRCADCGTLSVLPSYLLKPGASHAEIRLPKKKSRNQNYARCMTMGLERSFQPQSSISTRGMEECPSVPIVRNAQKPSGKRR